MDVNLVCAMTGAVLLMTAVLAAGLAPAERIRLAAAGLTALAAGSGGGAGPMVLLLVALRPDRRPER